MSKLFVIFMLGCLILSCDRDKTVPSTVICDGEYTFAGDSNAVEPIIQLTCAISGCHVAGEGIGDFTNYKNITSYIANGLFESRAFDIKDMPPDYSTGPKQLTEDELNQLKCWIQNGYPK